LQSANSRLISGAVVTSLLVALVALILLTLLNEGAGSEGALVDATQPAAVQPVVSETPVPEGEGGDPGVVQPATPEDAPATVQSDAVANAEGVADPEAGSAEEVVTEAANSSGAPEIAITIQPTPTRRSGEGEPASTAGETEASLLPAIDPESAPEETLISYANPNYVHDLLWLEGDLWAATSAGAQRWVAASGESERYAVAEGLATPRLRSVVNCPLEGFGLVFGSDAGLELYDTASGEWASVGASASGLPFANIGALACNETAGLLAVASPSAGIALFDVASREWTEVESDNEELLLAVRSLALDDAGVLWVAAGANIVQVVDGEVAEHFDADNSPLTGETVTDVAVHGDGSLWATAGDRLFHLLDEEWKVYRGASDGSNFPTGTLVSIAPASNGRVWIASNTSEICRFDSNSGSCAPWYADDEGMAQSALTALAVGADGALAFSTTGGGVSALESGAWSTFAEEVTFPAGNRIFSLASDGNGYLWVASSGGVQQTNPANPQGAVQHSSGNGGPALSNPRTLFADSSGGVWLGGLGASRFDGATWTNYGLAEGLIDEEITSITQDSQGRIWFGTRAGLSIWTGTTFFNLTSANGLPDAEILALAADADSVWIGSASGGLYRFENNQLQVLTQENVGLPSDRILSLLVAADRSLYVGTDRGLARFARGEFVPVGGVPDVAIPSLAQSSNGTLWAATSTSGVWTQPAGVQPTRAWVQVQSDAGALPPSVRTITTDLFGGLWMGTDDAGLVRLAP